MKSNLKLVHESGDANLLQAKLGSGIRDYAFEKKGHKPIEAFAISIRNENDEIKGGCNGAVYYGCLYVDQLWIKKEFRHQGLGKQLMNAAEILGKGKGCLFSTVNTMDWEALDFYKKLGYFVEFERKGYHKNSVFYFLRKDFTEIELGKT